MRSVGERGPLRHRPSVVIRPVRGAAMSFAARSRLRRTSDPAPRTAPVSSSSSGAPSAPKRAALAGRVALLGLPVALARVGVAPAEVVDAAGVGRWRHVRAGLRDRAPARAEQHSIARSECPARRSSITAALRPARARRLRHGPPDVLLGTVASGGPVVESGGSGPGLEQTPPVPEPYEGGPARADGDRIPRDR